MLAFTTLNTTSQDCVVPYTLFWKGLLATAISESTRWSLTQKGPQDGWIPEDYEWTCRNFPEWGLRVCPCKNAQGATVRHSPAGDGVKALL